MGVTSKFFQAGGDRLVDAMISKRDGTLTDGGAVPSPATPQSKFFQAGGDKLVEEMIATRDAAAAKKPEPVPAPVEKETVEQEAPSKLARAIQSARHERGIRTGQTQKQDNDFNTWLGDVQSFSQRVSDDYTKRQGAYQDPESFRLYQSKTGAEIADLLKRARSAQDYYTQYGKAYDEVRGAGSTAKLLEGITQNIDYLENVSKSLQSEGEWWGQFKDQDEYDEYQRYKGYADLTKEEDFAENSRYRSTRKSDEEIQASRGPLSFLVPETKLLDYGDIDYDYINKDPEAMEKRGASDVSSGLSALGLDDSERLEMSDEEIAIFNYLYATRSPEEAYRYVADLTGELNFRQRKTAEEDWGKYASKHPVAASAFSILTSPAKGLSYLGQVADYVSDGEIDQNAGYNKFSYIPSAIRGQVSRDIEEKVEGFWGKAGSFAYQTGMSMGDFLLNAGITGGNQALSLAIMGTGAAADGTIAAKDRGLDDTRAFVLGSIAGVAEIVTEKISLEALLKPDWEKGVLNYVMKNALAEGSEEAASDLINWTADWIYDCVTGQENSEFKEMVRSYQEQGMSDGEAFGKAVGDRMLELGLDALGGALSGGIMSGFAGAGHVVNNYRAGRQIGGNVAFQTIRGNRAGASGTEGVQAGPGDTLQSRAGVEAGTDAPQSGGPSEGSRGLQRADGGVLSDPLVKALFGQKITAPQTEAAVSTRYDPMEAAAIRHEGKTFRNIIAGIDSSVAEFFEKWRNGRKAQGEKLEKLYLGKMSADLAQQVTDILGYDVAQRDFILTNDDVKHIMDEHGDPAAEIQRGNLPLDTWVFDSLQDVVTNPDSVEPGQVGRGGKNGGKQGVVFTKTLPNGKVVCIQFDNKGRGTMEVTTLYVKRGSTTSEMDADTAPIRTSETSEPVLPSDAIIPDTGRGVKGELAQDGDPLIQAILGQEEITPGDVENSVGAAARGFTTPGTTPRENTSRLAEGAAMFNRHEAEATAIPTREDYNRLFRYEVQSEEQSMQYAREQLYALVNGRETFLADFAPESYAALTEELRQAPAWNGVMTDMAMLIKQELQGRSINMETSEDVYVDWLETMREHATETGRGTQAWAKWTSRDNDAGQTSELDAWKLLENSDLTEAEKAARFRQIVQYDAAINGAETTGDLKSLILEIAGERGTLNGITGKQSGILTKVAENALDGMDFEQLKQFAYASSSALAKDAKGANMGQKAKTVQILNMLSNPKTAAKNLLGNTTFYGLDAMSMRGAALLDMAVSRLTGTRSMAFESSALASRQSREAIAKAVQLSLAEITMDVDMGSGNRYTGSGRTNKAKGQGLFGTRTAADTFAERVLSACERNMGYLMTATDEAYKGAARNTASGTQALIDAGKIQTEDGDYAKSRADELALYRTFQGNSRVTAAIQTIHDLLNLIGVGDSGKTLGGKKGFSVHSFGLGDLVSPFTRVAGNLASVGLDYSPVNAVKGTVELLDVLRRTAAGQVDPARQYKAVSDMARGLSGTAIAYGVAMLAKAGLVRRASDEEDKDVAALNQSEGLRGTQINIDAAQRWLNGESPSWKSGDTLVDLSNLEPINFIISLGVELADNEADGLLSTFVDPEAYRDTGTSLLQAAGDLPVLSSVSDLAKDTMVYGTPFPEAAAEMLGKTAISSITPNVVAAFAKGLDSKHRNLYTGDGVTDVLRDTLISRLPGARESLPTTVNTVGEEKDNPGTLAQRLLNAMLNPLGVNEYTQGEVSREMERVREETGDTSFYPTTRNPKSLSYKDREGETHEVALTYEQRQQFQRDCAAVQMTSTAAMMGSELYRGEGPETQAALLKRCYDFAYQSAKASVLGDDAADAWVRNARTSLRDIGLSQTEYLYYLEKYGSGVMSGSGYEKTCRMVKAGLTVDEWVRMYQNMDTDGNGAKSKAELTAYIEEHFPESRWSEIFEAYKGGSNWKNPYTE